MISLGVTIGFSFKTFKGFTFGTCYFCFHRLAQWLTSGNLLRYLPFIVPVRRKSTSFFLAVFDTE